MKRFQNGAASLLILACASWFCGCGGGSSSPISITLTSSSGVFSVDESEPNATPPVFPTLTIDAAVGGDTKNQGVTWPSSTVDNKNSGPSLTGSNCSGFGTGPGQCGTITNATPFAATFTPPSDLTASQTITLKVASITQSSLTQTATITIELPPTFTLTTCNPPSPPANTPCVLPAGKNGVPYTSSGSTQVTIAFTGGVSPYNFNQPALPACLKMTVSTTSQTATISGTPCGSGTATFTVTVTDSGGAPATSQLYSITIAPPPPLSITTNSLPPGLTNVQYNAAVVAQGGVAPLTWTMTPAPATSLPPGLAFNTATGLISGVPTAAALTSSSCSPAVLGTFCFAVQVQDSALPTSQVAPKPPLPPLALSITIQKPSPLQITTPSPLTSGTTATGYAAQLQATGGVTPYTWSVVQGQLPAGLSLVTNADSTATISGTPILAGDTTFTVQVADSEAVPAVKAMAYAITIAANTSTGTVNDSLLQGTYAFLFNGFDDGANKTPGTVQIVGTFIADGKGNITGGTENSNRLSGIATGAVITGGSYSIGADGRGTLELTSVFANNSPLTVDYHLVLGSSGGGSFFEDNSTKTSTDTLHTHGEAVFKPVSSASFGAANFAGNYAFVFPGQDLKNKPAALGGVIRADGTGTLTPGSSDFNDAGTFGSSTLSGDFSFLSGNEGHAALTFISSGSEVTLNFIFEFVSSSDLYFVECDSSGASVCAPGGPTMFRLAGEMILQQPNVVFNSTVLAGTSVVSGVGLNGSSSDVFAGLLTTTSCDGTTMLNLSYDENSGGTLASRAFSGTCTMGLNGNGRAAFVLDALDTFQRANGGVGQNWTATEGAFSILGDAVSLSSQGADSRGSMFWSADAFPNDQLSQITITSAGGAQSALGPAVRMQSTGESYYAVGYTSSTIQLELVSSGAVTVLGTFSHQVVAGDVLFLQVQGTNLTAELNGTAIITAKDSTLTSGSPGIFAVSASSPAFGNNWSGGPVLTQRVAAAYLTGPGQGFVLGNDNAVTTGLLEQQSGGPNFADSSVLGSYALSAPMTAETQVKDVLGHVVGDGSGDFIQKDVDGNTVSVVDEIDPPATAAPNLAQPLAAVLGGLPSTGRGTLTTAAPVPNGFPASAIFYVVSPGSIRMISADATDQHPNLFFLSH